MTGSTSSSSRALLLLCALAGGCAGERVLPHATTSFAVTITAPANLGTQTNRLQAPVDKVSLAVEARDQLDALDSGFSGVLTVSVSSLATLDAIQTPLTVTNGKGAATLELPITFGATYLWVEDATGDAHRAPSYAAGVSPMIWFREPFLDDIQRPDLDDRASGLRHSPLENKQAKIAGSKFGADGKLVVTGVYADGYTLSDVDCSYAPCASSPYSHGFAYTSSRPVDVMGRPIKVGQ